MISESTIITVAGIIVAAGPLWIAAWRQGAAVTKIADEVVAANEKADHIVTLTNGGMSAVKAELETANGQIKSLQEVIKTLADRNGRVDVATRIVKVEETLKVEPTKEP